MLKRPLVSFGAAFLVTALAALFVPLMLPLIAIPTAFGLLFLRGRAGRAALILSLGILTASAASGLFFVRLDTARALLGTVQTVTGSVFADGGSQMALLETTDGKRHVARLFPPAEGLVIGDGIAGTVTVTDVETGGGAHLLSGGILLTCTPDILEYLPDHTPPPAIRGMLFSRRMCARLRALAPVTATDTTVAVLFSVKSYMTAELREAFTKSGMAHLLAVSGLHLSILVLTLTAGIKRLGGGKGVQAAAGSLAALFVFFAAGMTPSVFRAAFMVLLTLFASLISRKSDGLTSLTLAAVIPASLSPPILADLSFLLSFSSVAGILLLSPRLFAVLERLWISRFSRCGRAARWTLSAVSVSAAAQLASAPVVALTFGTLPLLGIVINLLAIPLVYPVLIFGFAACGAVTALPRLAALLLLPANLCSALLGAVARFAARLPFCSLSVVFPSDLLPLVLLALIPLSAAVFPHRIRLLRRVTLCCGTGALLCAVTVSLLSYTGVTVASSSLTGSLIIADRDGGVVLDNTQSEYHRELDSRLLARLGIERPDALVTPHPYDTPERVFAAALHYGGTKLYGAGELAPPITPLPGILISSPSPYVTEITIRNTKLMKFYATYDTIEELNISGDNLLLADRQGNLLSPGGKRHVFRRGNGESFTRIYGWE